MSRRPAARHFVLAGGVAIAVAVTVPSLGWAVSSSGPAATSHTATSDHDGAGWGRGSGRGDGEGRGRRNGQGQGQRQGHGQGQGAGAHAEDPLAGLAKGVLTPAQASALASMAEEEKLAHDVYLALAGVVGDARLSRIAQAESRHLDELRALMTRYGVSDPTAGRAAGAFADPAVAELYRSLVKEGSASTEAAAAVGRKVETQDIADLAKAGSGVSAADVNAIYKNLVDGSRRHLAAFSR